MLVIFLKLWAIKVRNLFVVENLAVIKKSRTAIDDDPMANDDLRFCWRWIDRMYHFDDIHKLERIETLFRNVVLFLSFICAF